MKYNIAIIGTFDYENFGDLMFPIIFKKQIEKRVELDNLFLFSPNECRMPLNPKNVNVYSIDKLEHIHNEYGLNAIIFGGGDLVRLDNDFAPTENYIPTNTSFDLMVYSAIVANKYDIPFLWNCPGVPFVFKGREKLIVKYLIDELSDYVSVRDARSAEILKDCDVATEVNVSFDTVLSVSRIIDKNENGIFDRLCDEFDFLKSGYVVFQSMINNSDEFKSEIKTQLKIISDTYNKKIVFLPIGNVHSDDLYISSLISEYQCDSFVTFNRKLDIFEINAILANSFAFIGTSLHGNVVSNSYGVQSIGINLLNLVKLKNYFLLLNRGEYCVSDVKEISNVFNNMIKSNSLSCLKNAFDKIDGHFNTLAAFIKSDLHPNKKVDIKHILNALYVPRTDTDNYTTVYFDYGNGLSEKDTVKYPLDEKGAVDIDITVPDGVIRVRIDPVNAATCMLTECSITIDEKAVIFDGNYIVTDDDLKTLLFLNSDPQIVFDVNPNVKTLNCCFNAFELGLKTGDKLNKFEDVVCLLNDNVIEKDKIIDSQNDIISQKDVIIKEYQDIISEKNDIIKSRDEKIVEIEEQKNEIINQNNSTVNQLNSIIATKDNDIANILNQNAQISFAYNEIQNSFFWRITSPLRKISIKTKSTISKTKWLMVFFVFTKGFLRGGIKRGKIQVKNYYEFLEKNKVHTLMEVSKDDIKYQQNFKFSKNVKFSILVPLYNTPKDFLVEMIKSVQDQTYKNWELCLADGSTNDFAFVEKVCKKFAKKDKRIVYKKLEKNLGISENTNACIRMATGDYIALFDHDDVLHPFALFECMKQICDNNADYVYTDEATFLGNDIGNIITIHYKPDYAKYNLLANNYICHFSVFSAALIKKAGMFRNDYDGSQDHDMILRLTDAAENVVHIPKILYFWRSHENSVAMDINSKTYAIKAGQNAVHDFLESKGIKSKVTSSPAFPTIYRINFDIADNPLISIIIPTKDHFKDLFRCVTSIKAKSTYKNYEIVIVDNGSTDKKTLEYFEKLKTDEKVKILSYDLPFNYSAINNYAVDNCDGDYVLLLNNDTEVITPDWIEQLLMYAQHDDVGAVGAKLFFADKTVQHGGIILGLGADRTAGHSHYGVTSDNLGYMGKMFYAQNVTAVTAACMMVKKSKYSQVNGFDEEQCVAYNDVDFCLQLDKAGYQNIFNPFCELYHYESASRGLDTNEKNRERFLKEAERFKEKWHDKLAAGDPYYNVNFSLDESYAIR